MAFAAESGDGNPGNPPVCNPADVNEPGVTILGGDTASSLLGGGSSIMSALDTLQSQAKGVADSLQDTLQTQAPLVSSSLTSVTSAAGAVAGHLQQTVEEQMSQFSDEQAKFCTAEAKRAEVRDYTQAVYTVGKTIGVPPLQQAADPTLRLTRAAP